MKKLGMLPILMAFLPAFSQGKFLLKGQLQGIAASGEKVFLYYSQGDKQVVDSAEVSEGKYHFEGFTVEPVMARLRLVHRQSDSRQPMVSNSKRDLAALFLEPQSINVLSVDSFANVQVSGSDAHKEYLQLQDMLKELNRKQELLMQEYRTKKQLKDEAGMKAIEKQFEDLDQAQREVYRQYLEANPRSPIAIYALEQFAGWEIDAAAVAPLFEALPDDKKQLPSAQSLYRKIALALKSAVGQLAMDFTQADTSGNPVTLSAFRGKYVLMDFWASWCGPCRIENPNLVRAYQRFRDRGFHIIGISLDQPNGREKWLKAIHDDQLTWTHVSDLNFWKNAVAVQYGINAIPQNFLLDPEGKIIARNLRGEDLMTQLEKLFQ